MLDDIASADHPRYLALYGCLLIVCHGLSFYLLKPANSDGKLSDGEVHVNRHRYANKAAGGAHACVLAVTAVRCGVIRGFDLHADRLLDLPPLEHLTVGFMLVYLVYDTAFLFWRNLILQPSMGVRERWTFGEHTLAVAHHVLGFAAWWLIYGATGGVYWAQLIHVAELSTPILNARFVLVKEGVRSGPLYVGMSVLFLVTFFLSRIPTTATLLYYMWIGVEKWSSASTAYFQFGVTFCYFVINLLWFMGGVKMAIKTLSGKVKSK